LTFARRVLALTDPLAHALIAAAVVSPLAARAGRAPLVTAVVVATAIDVDHPLAARSLRLEPIVSLAERPRSHNLTVALGLGALGTLAAGPAHGWAAFSGLASHLLYDAGDSTAATPLLWPWRGAPRQIGRRRSLAGIAALALGSVAVGRAVQARSAAAPARSSEIDSSLQVARKPPTTSRTSSSDSAR
jgi:hypothetical protein